jgi:acyl dehydratase
MPIDPPVAVGAELEPVEFSWSSGDVQLYHLGLGAGADPMDQRELRYLVDDTRQVLPTFGNVAQSFHMTEPQDRAPDLEVALPILAQQALLYRLCGDRNPLHSDPEFAAAAGFPRPILHGLCTYGIACKPIVDNVLDGDVSLVHSYGARFAGVVFPGETLRANIWRKGDKLVATITAPSREDAVVLSGVELCRPDVPEESGVHKYATDC